MSRSFTLGGQYGTIPYDEYLRKIQQSAIDEEQSPYETFLRRELADYTPDAPFFEADQPRDPSDRGGGTGSKQFLSLRYEGARSDADPFLPDGTFLDYEFAQKDPRGTANVPNFGGNGNSARRHNEARASYVKFYNDNDYSVPESALNASQIRDNIRNNQNQFKARFRNFDESSNNFVVGSAHFRNAPSGVAMVTTDGTIINLAEAGQPLRQDPVNMLSNRNPELMRHATPDHKVKISKYGMVKPMMQINYNNWHTNRYNSYLDHSIPVELNGQMVNRGLALMILDLEGQRSTKQAVIQGVDYKDSHSTMMRESKKKINPEDIYKLMMIGLSSNTQASQEFQGKHIVRHIKSDSNLRDMLNNTELNHDILNSMISCNREKGKLRTDDLRESIQQTASDNGLYITNIQRENSIHKSKGLIRESRDTRHIEDHKEVKIYSNILPQQSNIHNLANYEPFKKNSHNNHISYRNNERAKNQTISRVNHDVNMSEFNLPGARKSYNEDYEGRNLQPDSGDIELRDSI